MDHTAATQTEVSPTSSAAIGATTAQRNGKDDLRQQVQLTGTLAEQEALLAPPGDVQMHQGPTPGDAPPAPTHGQTEGDPAREALLNAWRPRIVEVTDPVAFMDQGSYVKAIKGGAEHEAGFYAQAIGELDALLAEVLASGDAGLEPLAAMLQAWRGLYETLRDTADSPSERDAITESVLAVVEATQGAQDAVPAGLLGAGPAQRLDASLDDVRTFVGSWSLLAEATGTSAAKPMWASFLQTTQRHRMILAEYGALEERGGDATGTAKMAVKNQGDKHGYAQDREDFEQAKEDAGGTMVLAMQTYSYKAANQAAMKVQIDEFLVRVGEGEFKSEDEAKAAARAVIGGGRASQTYYKLVDHYVSAAWNEHQGKHNKVAGDLAVVTGESFMKQSGTNVALSHWNLASSKGDVAEHNAASEEGFREKSEKAWASSQSYLASAKQKQLQAEQLLTGANANFDLATKLYAEANANIETARNHLAFIDPAKHPEFQSATAEIQQGLGKLEAGLAVSEERLAEAKALAAKIAEKAASQRAALTEFDPQKMEVEVPEGLAGFELSTFTRGSLSVSAKIPGAPFISIDGSAEVSGGVKSKDGGQWGFLESEWSLGMTIDLILFKLSAAYVAGSSVEARDKLTPPEVMQAGERARSRYAAKRQIFESGAAPKLAQAFVTNKAAIGQIYGELAKDGEALASKQLTRSQFSQKTFLRAAAARNAQKDLGMDISMSFLAADMGFIDSFMQGASILSPSEVFERTLELADVQADKAAGEIQGRGADITDANEEARLETKAPMDKIADYTNDPNVTFSDYGGWEFGVEAGGSGYSFGAKFRTVTVTSDGDGELYDFEDHKESTLSLEFEAGSYSGEVSGTWVDGEFASISVDGSLEAEGGLDEEKSKTIREKAKAFGAGFGDVVKTITDPKQLAKKLAGFAEEFSGAITPLFTNPKSAVKNSYFDPGSLDGTPVLSLGFDIEANDGKTDVYFRLGHGALFKRTMNAGVFEIEAELETGQEGKFLIYSG